VTQAAITLEHVGKRFGSTVALTDLSLSIAEGSVFGILGPNGAGKSTALRICSTWLQPDTGTVRFHADGNSLGRAEIRKSIGLMPQGQALDPMLNVEDNLLYYCKLIGLSRSETKEAIEEVAPLFGLESFRRKNVFAISGGQFRRAQLARTFLGKPRFLLLDEPTLGIDIQGKLTIWKKIREFVNSNECTVLLASNDLTEVEMTCDSVGFINRGNLLYSGITQHLSLDEGRRLICTLASPFQPNVIPTAGGIEITEGSPHEVSLEFAEYGAPLFSCLEQLSQKFGMTALSEERVSLSDLFNRYGKEGS
jgi:ABC-2 type transport system ATP-binding protein